MDFQESSEIYRLFGRLRFVCELLPLVSDFVESFLRNERDSGIILNWKSYESLSMALLDLLDTIIWVIRRPMEAFLVALVIVAFIAFFAPQLSG